MILINRSVFAAVALATTPAFGQTEATPSASTTVLNGAGATFPAPLYSRWVAEFEKLEPTIKINYQPIGSGGGIKQFIDGTVDFGGTDAPMTDEQIAQAKGNVIHIPAAVGAVVLTYNLPEVSKPLQFSPDTICGIALGKITKWNDKRIVALNKGVKLPADSLTFVHRSDGSGTSAIFTDYLSKVCPEWKEKVGAGTAVNWPAGLGGKGNDGVSGLIKQTAGSVGYVELIFAEKNNLPVAIVKNRAGTMVKPSIESVTDALAAFAKTMPEDFRLSITNPEGKKSYPISGMTWLLVHKTMTPAVGTPMVKYLKWALTEGQKINPTLNYAPLPSNIVSKAQKAIDGIEIK